MKFLLPTISTIVVLNLSPLTISAFGETVEDDGILPIADLVVEIPKADASDTTEAAEESAPPTASDQQISETPPPDIRNLLSDTTEQLRQPSQPVSCKALAEMPHEQRLEAVVLTDVEAESFCTLADGGSCADYQENMEEFGKLKQSSSPIYCKLIPMGGS